VDDPKVVAEINRLAAREHELRTAEASGPLSDADHVELQHIELHLDQTWDLLRQRRARQEFGQDAATAERSIRTVEGYQQ
jgi:hypothetical protein